MNPALYLCGGCESLKMSSLPFFSSLRNVFANSDACDDSRSLCSDPAVQRTTTSVTTHGWQWHHALCMVQCGSAEEADHHSQSCVQMRTFGTELLHPGAGPHGEALEGLAAAHMKCTRISGCSADVQHLRHSHPTQHPTMRSNPSGWPSLSLLSAHLLASVLTSTSLKT